MPNIHPLVIHFPIAFLIAAFICEIISQFFDKAYFGKTAKWALLVGTITLGIAAFTGWLGHKTVAHSEASYQFIERHQQFGFISLGLFVGLLVYRFVLLEKTQKNNLIIGVLLTLNFIGLSLMSYGAHLGGELVFKYGVGVESQSSSAIENSTPVSVPHDHQEHEHRH